MSCCGRKRNEYLGSLTAGINARQQTAAFKKAEDVSFEYTGETGLTVTGDITGRRYRFDTKGVILLVDARDVGGMMAVSRLKKL